MKARTLITLLILVCNSLFADSRLPAHARAQIGVTVEYDPSYVSLKYPGGDVPQDRGVCTDVVIRAMRQLGFDLQKEVHEDMKKNFSAYPSRKNWGLKRTDRNIDHRRVPNLQTFFQTQGVEPPRYPKPGGLQTGGYCHLPAGGYPAAYHDCERPQK